MSRTNEREAVSDRSAVHRLETSVEWPPGHAAAYLLADEEPILVDTGMYGEEARSELVADLEAHGYEPAAVEHLLVTHAHVDHVGQVQMILEVAEPTVYAPATVRECFERDLTAVEAATRRNLAAAGLEGVVLETAVDEFLEIHEGIRRALSIEDVDVWIEDGESFRIDGRTFEPIHTPGHHVTHHCYGTKIGDDRVVFAGDMVLEPFRSAAIDVNFDDGVDEAIDVYLAALERLGNQSFDRVYPGHGPIHEAYAETVTSARADLERRLEDERERLAEACDDDSSVTALELVADRTDDPRQQVLMLRETVAALGSLERQGDVRSRLEDGVRYYEPRRRE